MKVNYERQNASFKYLVMGYGECNFLSFVIQAVDLMRQCLSMCSASVLSFTVSYKPEDIEGEMCCQYIWDEMQNPFHDLQSPTVVIQVQCN